MRSVALALLILPGCGLQISGTILGDVPSGATAVVLWQGWNVLGANGGTAVVEDGAFELTPNAPSAPEALGFGVTHMGLVVLVDQDFDPAEPISPESVDHILAADPHRAVHLDPRPRKTCMSTGCQPTQYAYGPGISCVACVDGGCDSSPCDEFVLTNREDVLNQPFLTAIGGYFEDHIYDESGRYLTYATKGTSTVPAALWTVEIGAPRQLLYEFPNTYQVLPTSFHQGEGLIAARVETLDGSVYSVIVSTSGELLWTIEQSTFDGPYLSSNGRLVTWAEPGRVEIASARTGQIAKTHLFSEGATRATLHWSAVEPTVYAFIGGEPPQAVTYGVGSATDWPQCDGARSASSNRCPEPDAPYVSHLIFGQVTLAAPYECGNQAYSLVPRVGAPPGQYLAPCIPI